MLMNVKIETLRSVLMRTQVATTQKVAMTVSAVWDIASTKLSSIVSVITQVR